jgi:hypothetical protein
VSTKPIVSEQWTGRVAFDHEVDSCPVEIHEEPEGEYHELVVIREAAELLGQPASPGLAKWQWAPAVKKLLPGMAGNFFSLGALTAVGRSAGNDFRPLAFAISHVEELCQDVPVLVVRQVPGRRELSHAEFKVSQGPLLHCGGQRAPYFLAVMGPQMLRVAASREKEEAGEGESVEVSIAHAALELAGLQAMFAGCWLSRSVMQRISVKCPGAGGLGRSRGGGAWLC